MNIGQAASASGVPAKLIRYYEHLAEHCQGDARLDCPILDDLPAGASTR